MTIEVEAVSMPCPWPYCKRRVALLTHAPSSDRLDEQVTTVEQHDIEGPNSWYQTWCPASHLLVPLSPRGLQVIEENNARFRQALAERSPRQSERPADLREANVEIERRKRAGELGHLDGDPRQYFPPRPSDVEDAEAEYRGVLPEGVEGKIIHGRGSSNMTSSNETTLSLIAMAKQKIGEAQEACSSVTTAIEMADAACTMLDGHLNDALNLINHAAVGAGGEAPAAALEAMLNVGIAATHIEDAASRLAGAVSWVENSFQAAHHAGEKLDEFHGATLAVTTYEQVHVGAVVLGYDGATWGVEHIEREPVLAVTLVRHGHRLTGYPPAGTEVTVIEPANVVAEARAAGLFIESFGSVELLAEHWESGS